MPMSTHYRQGPEDRFPAAHEDTLAAYQWLLANGESLGGDPSRIALVGESAGGNMAADIALAAREQKLAAPVHQVLVYPVADDSMQTPSYAENAQAKPLGKAAMEWFVKYAFDAPADAADPRIRLVGRTDLQGLPPATVILAQIDPLRSEGETYGQNLQKAGVDTVIEEYAGVTHEFFGMGGLLPEAKDAQALVGERLRAAFGTGVDAGRPRPRQGTQGDRGAGLR